MKNGIRIKRRKSLLIAGKIRHIITLILKSGLGIMKVSTINSFLLGAAKALDLGNAIRVFPVVVPRLSPQKRTSFYNDIQALANDWNMVGKDIRSALRSFKAQHARKP